MVVTFDQLMDTRTLRNVFAHVGQAPADGESLMNVMTRRTGSSDSADAWTAEDRAVLQDVIADAPFPPEHHDVMAFYFGDR
jgi:hypothetical protein